MTDELNDIVLLRTAEAARMLHISVKTVNRWTDKGILPCKVRTLGGHRRYDEQEVRKLQWLLRQGKGRPKRGRPRRDRSATQQLGHNGAHPAPGSVPGAPVGARAGADAATASRAGLPPVPAATLGNLGNGFRPVSPNGTGNGHARRPAR